MHRAYFFPLSCSYVSERNHLPPSLTFPTSLCVFRYRTTELVFFPSSIRVVFFRSHLMPVVSPNSLLSDSSHFLTLSRSFLKATPCMTRPYVFVWSRWGRERGRGLSRGEVCAGCRGRGRGDVTVRGAVAA
ncbi:hypothetical protein BDZ91DRAFT_813801, partial [Kalaharituber pfeilii]